MSLPWSEKAEKAEQASNDDEILILDSTDSNPDTTNKRLKLSNLPGGTGGVSDGTNLGIPGSEVFAEKAVTILQFRKLIGESNRINLTQNDDDITFTLDSVVVTTDDANTYGAGNKQSFVADDDNAGININNQVPAPVVAGDIFRSSDTLQYGDSTPATREIVDLSLSQTLLNKSLDVATNIITGLTLGSVGANKVVGSSSNLADSSNIPLLSVLNDFAQGTKSLFFVSENSSPSSAGILRLTNTDVIGWRNSGNSDDLLLEVDKVVDNDFLKFNSSFVAATTSQGTADQVLTSNGSDNAPTFQSPATSGTLRIVRLEGSNVSVNKTALNFLDTANNINFLVEDDTDEAEISASISSTYPGQSSIVTLGTVTTGEWQADTIAVPFGGTGVTTLTDGGILLGSGTSAITAFAVLGDGEILIGDGTTDPATLDVGSSSAITLLGTVTSGTWQAGNIAVLFGGTGVTTSTGSGSVVLNLSPTLTTPIIASFSAANHDHSDTAGGGQISLTDAVTDALPVENGGTGRITLTENGILFGNGTSAIGNTGVGTAGEVLTSNGSGNAPAFQTDSNVVTLAGTQTLTNKTLTAPRITSASSINDSNGAELILFPSAVVSAINEITISNEATGNAPIIKSSGDNTDVSLDIDTKGIGTINLLKDVIVTGRFQETSDDVTVVAGGDLTLTDGNTFYLQSTETLVGIATAGWQVGSKVTIIVDTGSTSFTNGGMPGSGFAPLDLVTGFANEPVGTSVTFVFTPETTWLEIGRVD
jgi:hypothetical protein